tara:strand:- start:233 stop:1360 length:1128 start_codon:yes stop_codon:yes gene_type:complete
MTDENRVEDQDVELNENENVDEAHDPKNAPAQEVAAADAAGNASGTAKKRKGDKGGKDPMGKVTPGDPDKHSSKVDDKGAMPFKEGKMQTKASMINAAFQHMNKMSKQEMAELYGKLFNEGTEEEVAQAPASDDISYEADFSQDLEALVNSEATLSEEFKDKAGTIMEAAIKSKLAEEIDRLEAKYNEELQEEVESTKTEMVEKVDSYLNYVVENWMEENKLAVQSGLRTEIAEKFMNNLRDLFEESYIEVPESKVDLVDELAETVEELEQKLNETTGQAIEQAEELEQYKRNEVIREQTKDLAETQVEKLKGLVENIDFEDEETFTKKVSDIKESYFNKAKPQSAEMDAIEEEADITTTSGSMAQYISALKKTK